jgi:hypothetical protein
LRESRKPVARDAPNLIIASHTDEPKVANPEKIPCPVFVIAETDAKIELKKSFRPVVMDASPLQSVDRSKLIRYHRSFTVIVIFPS